MTMTANNSTVEDSVSLSDKCCTTTTTTEKSNPLKSVAKQKSSESRKIRKPLMEKKRRARINQSLNELKRILLEANGTPSRKEGNRPAKLEKADILELTVRHLQTLQNKSANIIPPTPRVPVTSSTTSISDIEVDEESSSSTTSSFIHENTSSKNNKTNRTSMENPIILNEKMTSILDTNRTSPETLVDMHVGNNTYLIPTRLSNGDIAFVLKRSGNKNPNTQQSSKHFFDLGMEINSKTQLYFGDDFKSSSHTSDNHNNSVYLNKDGIHTTTHNNDNHLVIWRPW